MNKLRRFLIYLALAAIPVALFQTAIILDHTTLLAGKLGFSGLLWAVFGLFATLATCG